VKGVDDVSIPCCISSLYQAIFTIQNRLSDSTFSFFFIFRFSITVILRALILLVSQLQAQQLKTSQIRPPIEYYQIIYFGVSFALRFD